MMATIAHGSPYAYFQLSTGDLQVQPASGFNASLFKSDARVLLVEGKERPTLFLVLQGVFGRTLLVMTPQTPLPKSLPSVKGDFDGL